jgi:alpha-1,2-mannosyltransferase
MEDSRRTFLVTLLYATGAIVGWPFALALAIPFVFEELFILGADRVAPSARFSWTLARWKRLFGAGLAAALIFIPVVGIDTLAYGKLAIVPWNIIRYNIFGGSERGPDLYGTSPWNFYLLNLILNFNVLVPLSLLSLPALYITSIIDRKRLGFVKAGPDQSSPFVVLGIRLMPLYVWMGILTLQAHKEERFMFPAYPILCFNAAVALYLIRGWFEVVYVHFTNSPYKASRSSLFSNFTSSVVCGAALISLSRILALWNYYHAPLTVFYLLESTEIPRLLNSTGLLPLPPPNTPSDELPRIDLSPVKQFNLTLCLGKEWFRFPGHYLVPDGVRVDFVKSEFDGALPGHFVEGEGGGQFWWRDGTRRAPEGLNDLNREAPQFYVPIQTCDYLVDLDFPRHPSASSLEPRYALDSKTWERAACVPFLDASHSSLLTRTLWMPGEAWQSLNEYGDYCLLKNKERVSRKEKQVLKSR